MNDPNQARDEKTRLLFAAIMGQDAVVFSDTIVQIDAEKAQRDRAYQDDMRRG